MFGLIPRPYLGDAVLEAAVARLALLLRVIELPLQPLAGLGHLIQLPLRLFDNGAGISGGVSSCIFRDTAFRCSTAAALRKPLRSFERKTHGNPGILHSFQAHHKWNHSHGVQRSEVPDYFESECMRFRGVNSGAANLLDDDLWPIGVLDLCVEGFRDAP